VFYLAHTSCFFINKLLVGRFIPPEQSIDSEIESLCAVGVDEQSWDSLQLGIWDKYSHQERISLVIKI
jgi:hypothetical protein